MWTLVWSPIPLIINFLLFLVFSTPAISARKWGKIGRVLVVSLFLIQIIFMFIGFNEKIEYGRRKSDAEIKGQVFD